MVVLIASFSAARLALRWRINAELQAIRDAGYPASVAELEKWAVHVDREIGADNLARACAGVTEPLRGIKDDLPFFRSGNLPGNPTEPLPKEVRDAMRVHLAANREALGRLHKVVGFGHGRGPIDWSQQRIPHLGTALVDRGECVQHAARLLAIEAIEHAERSQTDDLVASLLTAVYVARSLETEVKWPEQYYRLDAVAVTIDAIEWIVSRVPLSDAQLEEFISTYEHAERRDAFQRVMAGYRAQDVDIFTNPSRLHDLDLVLTKGWRMDVYRLSGLLDLDRLRYLAIMGQYVDAAGRPVHERLNAFSRLDRHERKSSSFGRTITTAVLRHGGAFDDVAVTARLRTARAALSAERYRRREGRWPTDLRDVAPDFIDELPADAFTGAALKYSRTDDRVVVYCVGEDQKDDGGVNDKDSDDIPFSIRRPVEVRKR
ncbi:MAG: hypothetical protein OER86_08570 [Phycisphaerae bacterium]|nr:hypothetical protein [Phycisphaerae bacterium]